MRAPAPPYRGERGHALWHVSEDDSIRGFEPREGLVWAVDTRHLPLYWFPRQCPRATFWAGRTTSRADVEGSSSVVATSACTSSSLRASTLEYSGIRLRNAR